MAVLCSLPRVWRLPAWPSRVSGSGAFVLRLRDILGCRGRCGVSRSAGASRLHLWQAGLTSSGQPGTGYRVGNQGRERSGDQLAVSAAGAGWTAETR